MPEEKLRRIEGSHRRSRHTLSRPQVFSSLVVTLDGRCADYHDRHLPGPRIRAAEGAGRCTFGSIPQGGLYAALSLPLIVFEKYNYLIICYFGEQPQLRFRTSVLVILYTLYIMFFQYSYDVRGSKLNRLCLLLFMLSKILPGDLKNFLVQNDLYKFITLKDFFN